MDRKRKIKMLTRKHLEKIGFDSDDIDFLLIQNQKYKNQIGPIVKEYMTGLTIKPYVPYAENGRSLALQRANAFVKKVHEKIPDENAYTLNLLAWLNCMPYLHDIYKQYGISDHIYYESMKDFLFKTRECKAVYDVCGVFVNWFFLFFELKEFSLGRLQYEVYSFDYEEYTCQNMQLKKRGPGLLLPHSI